MTDTLENMKVIEYNYTMNLTYGISSMGLDVQALNRWICSEAQGIPGAIYKL